MSTATMRKGSTRQRHDTSISLRLPTMLRDLIDNAAHLVGKTRSDFILESAKKHAIDVLLDQRLFTLTPEQYDAFIQVLDEPPTDNQKLKQLLSSKSPWEK